MAVYVKGMGMPEHCLYCPFNSYMKCTLNNHKNVDASWHTKERDKDCPLIPVPPHGDLIDRDALPTSRVEWEDIINAPTIIPADEPKEE